MKLNAIGQQDYAIKNWCACHFKLTYHISLLADHSFGTNTTNQLSVNYQLLVQYLNICIKMMTTEIDRECRIFPTDCQILIFKIYFF